MLKNRLALTPIPYPQITQIITVLSINLYFSIDGSNTDIVCPRYTVYRKQKLKIHQHSAVLHVPQFLKSFPSHHGYS
jgi:hypothetical protein